MLNAVPNGTTTVLSTPPRYEFRRGVIYSDTANPAPQAVAHE